MEKNKKLNPIDILSLALGAIIGWGSFTLPGTKFLPESGVINTAIGLILGGLAVTFIQKGYHVMLITTVKMVESFRTPMSTWEGFMDSLLAGA